MADKKLLLVHDVLDAQLLDREKRKSGRVDGIVLEIREGKAPRVAYLDVGTTVILRRLSSRLAEWYDRLRSRFISEPAQPFHIPWSKVSRIGRTGIEADVDLSESPVLRLERWLSDRVIGRIPGSAHEHKNKK